MTSSAGTLGRGLLAGALGTTLLNATTYLDMALTGRGASSAPEDTALAALDAAGIDLPTDANRASAYGALAGIGAGLGVGVLASVARRAGVRLPAPLGVVATGAAAMVATDYPMSALGVSDLATWSAKDWTRDVVPHLVYGAGVRWALDRTDPSRHGGLVQPALPLHVAEPTRVTAGLLLRSAALGVATGGRTTMGLSVPAFATGNPLLALGASTLVATELTVDKLPSTPSRLETGALLGRLGAGGIGGFALATREGTGAAGGTVAAVAGILGGFAGSVVGAMWREYAAQRGWTWQAAVAEDATALGLTALAFRGGR